MKIDPTHYSEERIKNIILTLPKREQLIVALAYGSGARVSELNQIVPEDITYEDNYMHISCKVLKKRKRNEKNTKRIALIRLDETWLIEPIKQRLTETALGVPLVPYTRNNLYRWLKKSTGINPHGFRAIRATHLAKKGLTAHQLKHFFGWSSVAPSDSYVRLNTEDIEY